MSQTHTLEVLWLWFLLGMAVYMLKRAYYLVTGPNPIATGYKMFFKVSWIPLVVRASVDSGFFWATFYPGLITPITKLVGWNLDVQYGLLHIGPGAFFFGLGVDSLVDLAVSKVPIVKDWLPQMPPPMKQPDPLSNPPAPPNP